MPSVHDPTFLVRLLGMMQVWRKRLGWSALFLFSTGLIAWASPGIFRALDERGTDVVWRLTASAKPEQRIVFVDIDDQSLAQMGPWPWPRTVLADLVRQLDLYGVGLKLFDMVLSESREGSELLSAALKENDASSPTLLGQVFALRNESTLHVGQPVGAIDGTRCPDAAVSAQGALANMPALHHRAGHISPALDDDGAVRRLPALVCYRGSAYPALPLAGLAAAADSPASRPAVQLQAGQGWTAPAWWIQMPGLPSPGVGLDADGTLRVPFRLNRDAWTSLSAADVLQGRVPDELLSGAWVVVGASAFGLSDAVPTPLGRAVTGAEVHAQLLAALLDDVVPYTPRMAWAWQLMFVIVVMALMWALSAGSPLRQGRRVLALPLVGVVAALLALLLHGALLWQAQWHVGWALPAVACVLMGSGMGLMEHARSLMQKKRLISNFSSYVPGAVAERIALQAPSGDIEAHRAEVTILSADVRNFSAYCEARSPEDTARVLHRFYTTASAIVTANGGVVEEMVGDSLLAVFNGPQPCDFHAERALAAAKDIWLQCGEELPNLSGQGLEPLAISVGLETGTALVGSFGAAQRRVHTVLGSTVTQALRLRDMTADLAYPVLVGQGAAQRIPVRIDQPDMVLKPLGVFLLPGLRQSGKIYTLRHLLQPYSAAEQRDIDYLNQQSQNA